MKRHLFIWTIGFIALLFFGISGSVLAATAGDDPETGNTGAGKTLVVSPYQNPLGVSSTTSSLTYFSPYTNLTYTVPSAVKALGVDVSHWRGTINWQKVKDDGITFALIAATHTNTKTGVIEDDAYLTQNIEGAQAVGIKVGVFIYSQAITVAEAQKEAQHVVDLVSGYHLDLPIVMDYEFADGHTGRLADANLSKREATDIVLSFCNYITDHGYIPMLYANTDMLNHLYPAEIEQNMDLWYANWPQKAPCAPLYTGNFSIWQYSAYGTVDGISGDVDCNFSLVDLDELGMPFDDAVQGSWYFNAVLYAYQQHLFNGTSSSTFEPNTAMSRAMLVSVLYRLEGSPAVDYTGSFTDLEVDSWYEDSVLWAEKSGIVNGVSATKFSPDANLTREQIATILYRYSQYKEYDLTASGDLNSFSDGSAVADYATTAMQWAIGKGYISGFDNGTLQAKATATRAQVATILMRYCEDHEE